MCVFHVCIYCYFHCCPQELRMLRDHLKSAELPAPKDLKAKKIDLLRSLLNDARNGLKKYHEDHGSQDIAIGRLTKIQKEHIVWRWIRVVLYNDKLRSLYIDNSKPVTREALDAMEGRKSSECASQILQERSKKMR
jgi:hypothetical protein